VVEEDLGSENMRSMSPKLQFSSSPSKEIPHKMLCLRYVVTKLHLANTLTQMYKLWL